MNIPALSGRWSVRTDRSSKASTDLHLQYTVAATATELLRYWQVSLGAARALRFRVRRRSSTFRRRKEQTSNACTVGSGQCWDSKLPILTQTLRGALSGFFSFR